MPSDQFSVGWNARLVGGRAAQLLAAAGLVLSVGVAALAQQQPPSSPLSPLGGGRALDANLSTTQGRINTQVFDLQAIVRYNNAVVTGGATGGRSLRVPTGYTSDYGGFGTSSALFRFNRDATDPRASVLGAGLTPGVGQSAFRAPLGTIGTGRIGSGSDAGAQAAAWGFQSSKAAELPRVGAFARARASGNSGLIVGLSDDGRGGLNAVRASTLRGLINEPLPVGLGGMPRGGVDPLTGRELLSASPGSGRPIDSSVNTRVRPDGSVAPSAGDPVRPGAETPGGNSGANPSSSPNANPSTSPTTTPSMDPTDSRSGPTSLQPLRSSRPLEPFSKRGAGSAQLEQARAGFRSALTGSIEAQRARDAAKPPQGADQVPGQVRPMTPGVSPAPAGGEPSAKPATSGGLNPLTPDEIEATMARLRARLLGDYTPLGQTPFPPAPVLVAAPGTGPRGSEPGFQGRTPSPRLTPEELPDQRAIDALRDMNVRLKELIPAGASPAQAADGYIKIGQQLLSERRYASAEQAFDQALVQREGDAMARVGRAHASIASGMLLSGSIELQRVLSDEPELIGVRFDPAVLMPKDRAAQIVESIEAQHEGFPGGEVSRRGALIQAYLGWQFDEAGWTKRGLEVMAQGWTQGPALELRRVVQGVWGK